MRNEISSGWLYCNKIVKKPACLSVVYVYAFVPAAALSGCGGFFSVNCKVGLFLVFYWE